MRHILPIALPIALVLVLAIAWTWQGPPADEPADITSPSGGKAGPELEGTRQVDRMEPLRSDIRRVAEEEVAAPPLPQSQTIARLPALPAPAPPPRKPKPVTFARPLAVSAGAVEAGSSTLVLAGIDAPDAGETCGSGAQSWPCGNFARAALQRLIRTRTLSCEAPDGTALTGAGGTIDARCRVGAHDLSAWLVEQGWARASDASLEPLEAEARNQGRGIWGPGPSQ